MKKSNDEHLREVEIKSGVPFKVSGSKGYFHRWTVEPFCESAGELLTKTYGLIELTDGNIRLIEPEYFKFSYPKANITKDAKHK